MYQKSKNTITYFPNDVFYEVKVYSNLFLVAQYFPFKKHYILSYLDDDSLLSDVKVLKKVHEKLMRFKEIESVTFENLSSPKTETDAHDPVKSTLIHFAKRFGVASKRNQLNYYLSKNDESYNPQKDVHNGYYPMKDTDKKFNRNEHGLFLNYGSTERTTTILAYLLNQVPINLLNQTITLDGIVKTNEELSQLFKADMFKSTDFLLPTAHNIYTFYEEMMEENYMPTILWNKGGSIIYTAWQLTNRFVDVARMNEKQFRTPLKRIVAQIGLDISEDIVSEVNNPIISQDNLVSIIKTITKETIQTKILFSQPIYQENYKVKSALLNNYPALVYKSKELEDGSLVPDVQADKVRSDRLTVNSTSAKLVSNVTAPYSKLDDSPCVSYLYPSKKRATELGIKPFDVLEQSLQWATDNIPNGAKAFQPIYDFYSSVRGRNVNDEIINDYPRLALIQLQSKYNLNYFYQTNEVSEDNPNETNPSSSMVTFSTGGIHGNEINEHLYEETLIKNKSINALIQRFKGLSKEEQFKNYEENPHLLIYDNRQIEVKVKSASSEYKEVLVPITEFIQAGADITKPHTIQWLNLDAPVRDLYDSEEEFIVATNRYNKWQDLLYESPYEQYREENQIPLLQIVQTKDVYQTMTLPHSFEYREVPLWNFVKVVDGEFIVQKELSLDRESILFTKNKRGYKLKDEFKFVSNGTVIHQDFKSYYATLMLQLGVFDNGNSDLFKEIMRNKEKAEQLIAEAESLLQNFEADNPLIEPLNEKMDYLQIERETHKLLLNAASGEADSKTQSNIRKNNEILSMRIIGQLFSWRIGQALTLKGGNVISTNTDGLYVKGLSIEKTQSVLDEVLKELYIDIEPEMIDYFVTKDSNNRIEIKQGGIVSAKGADLASYKGASVERNLRHPAIVDKVMADYLATEDNAPNKAFNEELAYKLCESVLNGEDKAATLKMFQWIVATNPNSDQKHIVYDLQQMGSNWQPVQDTYQDLQTVNRLYLVKPKGKKRTVIGLGMKHTRKTERIAKVERMKEHQPIFIDNHDVSNTKHQDFILNNLDMGAYVEMIREKIQKSWVNVSPTKT